MIPCIGAASGLGAGNEGCGSGPAYLKNQLTIDDLVWHDLLIPENKSTNKYDEIATLNAKLAKGTYQLTKDFPFFISFGGDHASAIGTWSGVSEAKRDEGDIGLIWIDAHMDAHTPETSPSGNIHGMPVACLLGFGDKRLTHILSSAPKIKPENIVLIGIRSFESEEAEFLKNLGVKIHFMDQVKLKGLLPLLKETVADFATRTVGYGVSFDLDSLDPTLADAVGTPVLNGITENDIMSAIDFFAENPPLAFELVEYNPHLDRNQISFHIIEKLLLHLTNNIRIYHDNYRDK